MTITSDRVNLVNPMLNYPS